MRLLGIADTDSYLKWGAATLDRTPTDWETSLILVETPFLPTEAQRRAAIGGLPTSDRVAEVLSLAEIGARVAEQQPDVVFLSLRGPVIRVVLRVVLAAAQCRPIFVSGLPGISIPATRRALAYRAQVDLMVLHSRREIREFAAVVERLGLAQQLGLATLPFLRTAGPTQTPAGSPVRDEIVFAAQAKVPASRDDRLVIVDALARCARAHPDLRVVLKLRATGREPQTHAEAYPYDELLAGLPSRPDNLVAEAGPMATHLARAIGLVSVSSTALVEALAANVPALAVDDFGVDAGMINTVFEGSGLFGSLDDVIAADFRSAEPAWLADNYFHDEADNDWIPRLESLVEANRRSPLALQPQRHARTGGALRRIWDRKRALGALDRSFGGYVALAVGYPARTALRTVQRISAIRRTRQLDPPVAFPAGVQGPSE